MRKSSPNIANKSSSETEHGLLITKIKERWKKSPSVPVHCPCSLAPLLSHTTVNHPARGKVRQCQHRYWSCWLACRSEQLPAGHRKQKGTVGGQVREIYHLKTTFFHKSNLSLKDKRQNWRCFLSKIHTWAHCFKMMNPLGKRNLAYVTFKKGNFI